MAFYKNVGIFKTSMLRKITCILWLVLLTLGCKAQVQVIFRYDDFFLSNPSFQDSLLYFFGKNDIPLCIGIVPFKQDGTFQQEMSNERLADLKNRIENKQIEVVMHGCSHKKHGLGEFDSFSYSQKLEMLLKGKMQLELKLDCSVRFFAPPWNVYDQELLKALDAVHFRGVTADLYNPISSSKLVMIPATVNGLAAFLDLINSPIKASGTIVVMFHQYSFAGNEGTYEKKKISFQQLESVFAEMKKLNWKPVTFSTAGFAGQDFSAFRYKLQQKALVFYGKKFGLNVPDSRIYQGRSVYLNWLYLERALWIVLAVLFWVVLMVLPNFSYRYFIQLVLGIFALIVSSYVTMAHRTAPIWQLIQSFHFVLSVILLLHYFRNNYKNKIND